MALTPLKLYKGDADEELVETFAGFTDLAVVSAAEQASYYSALTDIDNGVETALPFVFLEGTPDLLDLTDPTTPLFVEAGTYAVSASILGDQLTPAGFAAVRIKVTGGAVVGSGQGVDPSARFGAAATIVAAAGDSLQVAVFNGDGTDTRQFRLNYVVIVKL